MCFDLTDQNTQIREARSLVKAGVKLECKNLNLITVEKPKELSLPKEIKLVQILDFL